MEFVTVEKPEEHEGRVAVVRIARGTPVNQLSRQVLVELTEVARGFLDDLETRAVVLAGTDEVFTAGMDLKDAQAMREGSPSLLELRHANSLGMRVCNAWAAIEQVTIAAIEGYCIGGGVSLAVSCDFRVMAEGAWMKVPELELGMNYSWGSLPRLAALVGPARAKQIAILCERIPTETALAWGLAEERCADGEAVGRAVALAGRYAAMPPVPTRMTKRAVNNAVHALDQAVTEMDQDQFVLCSLGEDLQEGVSAFFEKRAPRFTGR